MTTTTRSTSYRWWLPLLLFLLIAPFTPWLDLTVADYFYEPNGFVRQTDTTHPIYSLLYRFGNLPGQIAGVAATLIFIAGFFYLPVRQWRKPALVLAITAVIGAGLFINVFFKELWGRPRPKQIEQFGGTELFHPFYKPIWDQKGEEFKSFPSGHAAMGFLFLTLGLIGWYERNRTLYIIGMMTGLTWGFVLSYTRMVQGGHFLSDIIASCLFMWLVGYIACRLIYGSAQIPAQ